MEPLLSFWRRRTSAIWRMFRGVGRQTIESMTGPTVTRPPRTTPDRLRRARIRSWFEARILDAMDPTMQTLHGRWKAELIGSLSGTVVEIGPGTGVNLRYYSPDVRLIAIEPNSNLHDPLRDAAARYDLDVEIRTRQAEHIDLDDGSVDAVVGTLVLCGVDDPARVVSEIHRILRPAGTYAFLEHVAAPQGTMLRRVQELLFRPQRWLANGCETNRDTALVIDRAGFAAVNHHTVDPGASALFIRPHLVGTASR